MVLVVYNLVTQIFYLNTIIFFFRFKTQMKSLKFSCGTQCEASYFSLL